MKCVIFILLIQSLFYKLFPDQNHYQKQTDQMEFKQIRTSNANQRQKNNLTYFNQLSISSIRQKNNTDQSLDFENEKLLFNQINKPVQQISNQYGLRQPAFSRNFVKKLNEDNKMKLARGDSNSRLQNYKFQQKNLCFNKQIKRKKNKTLSKQKNIEHSTQISTSKSFKQLKLMANLHYSSKKNSAQQKQILAAPLPLINIKSIFKPPQIALRLYEDSISFFKRNKKQNVKKLYHIIPDQLRIQINDFNHNLIVETTLSRSQKKNQKTKRNSQIFNCLKRSYHSKNSEYHDRKGQNSWALINSQSQKVVQIARPLSIDCRSSSFYSTNTQNYQSPISKDSSSTATRRIIRRSQLFNTESAREQQYFSPSIRSKKFYKQ